MLKSENDKSEKKSVTGQLYSSSPAHEIREPTQLLAKLLDNAFLLFRWTLPVFVLNTVSYQLKCVLAFTAITTLVASITTTVVFLAIRRRNLMKDEAYITQCALYDYHIREFGTELSQISPKVTDKDAPVLLKKNESLAASNEASEFGLLDWESYSVLVNNYIDEKGQVLSALSNANVPVSALFGNRKPEEGIVCYGKEVPPTHVRALMNVLQLAGCDCAHRIDGDNTTLSRMIYIGSYAS